MKSFNIDDANDAREFLKNHLLKSLPGELGRKIVEKAISGMTDEQIAAAAKALFEYPKAKEQVK